MKFRKTGDNNQIHSNSRLYWKSHYWGMRFFYDASLPYGSAAVLANGITCIIAVSIETTKSMSEFDDRFLFSIISEAAVNPIKTAVALPCSGRAEVDLSAAKTLVAKLTPELGRLTKKRIKQDGEEESYRTYRWIRASRTPLLPWLKCLTRAAERSTLATNPHEFKIPNSSYTSSIKVKLPILDTHTFITVGAYSLADKTLLSYSPRLTTKLEEVVKLSGRQLLDSREYDLSKSDADVFGWDVFEYLFSERRRARRVLPRELSSSLPADIGDIISHSWSAFKRLNLPDEVLSYLDRVETDHDSGRCYLCSDNSEALSFCRECADEIRYGLPIRKHPNWTHGLTWGIEQLSAEFGGAMSKNQIWLDEILSATPDEGRRAFSRMLALQGETTWSQRLAGIIGGYRPSWGTYSVATDGHFCRSTLERVIDDFMAKHEIFHLTEPLYPLDEKFNPSGLFRADWQLIDGTFVEALGALTNSEYTKKVDLKRTLAEKHKLRLVEITPRDTNRLPEILGEWIHTGPSKAK